MSSFKVLCSAGPRINLRLIGRMTGAGSNGKRYWTGGILRGRLLAEVVEIIGHINPVMDRIQMHLRPPSRGFILIPQPSSETAAGSAGRDSRFRP